MDSQLLPAKHRPSGGSGVQRNSRTQHPQREGKGFKEGLMEGEGGGGQKLCARCIFFGGGGTFEFPIQF